MADRASSHPAEGAAYLLAAVSYVIVGVLWPVTLNWLVGPAWLVLTVWIVSGRRR